MILFEDGKKYLCATHLQALLFIYFNPKPNYYSLSLKDMHLLQIEVNNNPIKGCYQY